MPQVIQKEITAGTSQYSIAQYHAFNNYETGCTNAIYIDSTDNATNSDATYSTVSINKPKRTDNFNLSFQPGVSAPLVAQNRDYVDVTATSATSTATFPVSFNDMSNDNYFRFVVKGNTAGQTSRFRIGDGTNSEEFTAVLPDANTWYGFTFTKGSGSISGTVDYSALTELTVAQLVNGQITSVAAFYSSSEEFAMPGQKLVLNIDCITAFGNTYTVDTADLFCGQVLQAKIPTGKTLEMTVETKETDILQRALSVSASLTQKNVDLIESLGNFTVSGTNTITVPAGINVANVRVSGGATLQETNVDVANIQAGHYLHAGTTITFGSGLDGQEVEVFVFNNQNALGYSDDGLNSGVIGYVQIDRATQQGGKRIFIVKRAQLSPGGESANDDGDATTFNLSALSTGNRSLYTEIIK